MYTERDKKIKETWEKLYESLRDIHDEYSAKLASDSSADKPMFEAQLLCLIETCQAQAKLWRNPDTAEKQKLEREHNIYSL